MALTKVSAGVIKTDELVGFRNKIINGAMSIHQRANVANTVGQGTAGIFSVDRWAIQDNGAGDATLQQDTDVPSGQGFKNSLLYTVVATAGSPTFSSFYQNIEGNLIDDFAWGTPSAKPVTLSFWAKSSVAGPITGCFRSYNGSTLRSYPFNFTINTSNNWEFETITVPGDTVMAPSNDNTLGLTIFITPGMAANSAYGGTPNQWSTANFHGANTGFTNLQSTNGATLRITGVQLEAGSTATPFERRPYGTELNLCKRYYEVVSCGSETLLGAYTTGNGSRFNISAIPFSVEKRAAPSMPTISHTGQWVVSGVVAVSASAATNFTPLNPTTTTFGVNVARNSGGSTPSNGSIYMWEQSAFFTASSEL